MAFFGDLLGSNIKTSSYTPKQSEMEKKYVQEQQDLLDSYRNSPIIEQVNDLANQIASGETYRDPYTSTAYEGLRQGIQANKELGQSLMGDRSGLAGFSGGTDNYSRQVGLGSNAMLGGLQENELNRVSALAGLNALLQAQSLQNQNIAGQSGLAGNLATTGQSLRKQRTQTESPSIFSQIGQVAGPIAGAIIASDIRLKKNIKQVGSVKDINFYTWDWKDEAKPLGLSGKSFGVIAQELEESNPDLVVEKDGYKQVLYGELMKEVA